MPSSSTLKIDLDAIEHNIRYFSQKGDVMAMIKANAYGTDAIKLAPFLQSCGVAMLGVAHVNEGIALREAGIEMPIFVISSPPFEALKAAQYHLQPAVSSFEEMEALNNAADEILSVHLSVNTGMNRFGAKPEVAIELAKAIKNAPHLHLEGVMTHFASAELPEYDSFSYKQISLLETVINALDSPPRWIHIANGAGAIRFNIPFCNLLRIGVGLFGYDREKNLRPALTFESHLSFISAPEKGESIGYSRAFWIDRDHMRVGIIPIGYCDGLHRHYKEKGYVIICGKQAPMIGNICMDFMMVDITNIPEAKVGDRVVIFDSGLSPAKVAQWGNTDVRELLVNIGSRTKRIFTREKYEKCLSRPIETIEENSPPTEHLLPA